MKIVLSALVGLLVALVFPVKIAVSDSGLSMAEIEVKQLEFIRSASGADSIIIYIFSVKNASDASKTARVGFRVYEWKINWMPVRFFFSVYSPASPAFRISGLEILKDTVVSFPPGESFLYIGAKMPAKHDEGIRFAPYVEEISSARTSSCLSNSKAFGAKYLVKPYVFYSGGVETINYRIAKMAIEGVLHDIQAWYCLRVGKTFSFLPVRKVSSPILGLEDNATINLIVGVGWGGYAVGAKYGGDYNGGFVFVGDWVLSPLVGRPCIGPNRWECTGGFPKGTIVHELGHAFGLSHPEQGESVMRHHGGFPEVGLLPSEVEFLRQSPFFR